MLRCMCVLYVCTVCSDVGVCVFMINDNNSNNVEKCCNRKNATRLIEIQCLSCMLFMCIFC